MKAILKLEAIGDDADSLVKLRAMGIDTALGYGVSRAITRRGPKRYWAAEITGFDTRFGYQRRFLYGKKDYMHANSMGSRGVYVYYTLESGAVYEVLEPLSWRKSDRYFCRVTDNGKIERILKEDVDTWLDSCRKI